MTPDARAERGATVSVGMIVGMSALAMTFATLLLAYGIVRAQAPAWPPPGEARLPSVWAWRVVATLACVAGSAAMARAGRDAKAGNRSREVGATLLGAGAAGLVFVGAQVATLAAIRRAGIGPGSGLLASVVFALVIFHGVHAVAALAALSSLAPARRRAGAAAAARVGSIAAFWHLVAGAWLAILLGVFVL